MILSNEQRLQILGGSETRGAHFLFRWPNGVVPYTIDWVLGHALGFFHEQSRPDRDKFVRELAYLTLSKYCRGSNFMKVKYIDSQGEPYDYDSLMHYGKTFFSKNGKPTLLPRKKGIEFGQRERVSNGDARQMNKMYSCF
ncbi:unnamed protein product [Porites evermanni]|uniref:Metalloendopeptidase n=1 Tax=Porites evermanni TaxID=104178 RepID=A0ABN8T2N0_9CNID|nr:unnamed protein product [Porites evermanni]